MKVARWNLVNLPALALWAAAAGAQPAAPASGAWLPATEATPAQHDGLRTAAAVESLDAELTRTREGLTRLRRLPEGAPLARERLAVASQLLSLLQARTHELVHATLLRQQPSGPGGIEAVAPKLGEPPHRVLAVDALQDRLELIVGRRDALEVTLRGFDDDVSRLLQSQRAATSRLRAAREDLAAGQVQPDDTPAGAALELAHLEALLASHELSRMQLRREVVSEGLARANSLIDKLRESVAKARHAQRLAPEDLAEVKSAVGAHKRAIAAERSRLGVRIAALEAASGPRSAERMAEIDALRTTEETLFALDREEDLRIELWLLRAALSKSATAEATLEAAERLARLREELEARRRAGQAQLDMLRSGLGSQPAVTGDGDASNPAILRLVSTLERLQQVRASLGVLAGRINDESSAATTAVAGRGWIDGAKVRLLRTAKELWHYELFTVTDTTHVDGRPITVEYGVTVGKSVGALLLSVIGYVASRRVVRRVVALVAPRMGMPAQAAQVVGRWLSTLLFAIILLIVLRAARIPLSMFAFLGGALAIGVGFGAQNIIRNVISGLIVLLERKIRVGDIVTVGGTSGRVVSLDLRATTVRDFDGNESIVPNSTLLEGQVGTSSRSSGATLRRSIAVGLAYGSDVRRASGLVQACASAHPAVLADPVPVVWFDDFGADALQLKLRYWISSDAPAPGPAIDSDLRFAIDDTLREAGIVMAFPQRDVHLDAAAPLRVEIARATRQV